MKVRPLIARGAAHASSCPRGRAAATPSSRPSAPLDRTGLLFLQRSAGNAAVAALLGGQRSAVPPGVQRQPQADPPALTSPLLAGSPRLQLAYHNQPTVKHHERSDGVKALQLALVQVGFGQLLTRTMKGGTPDGDYGDETLTAVRAFQTKHGVRPIGGQEAGHKTLLALDRALGAGPAPAPSQDGQSATVPAKVQGVQDPGSKTDNGKVVQKPEPKVNPTDTAEKKVQDDDRLSGNVVINLGGTAQWNTAKAEPPKSPPSDLDALCDHGVMQIGGKLNVPWSFNRGKRTVKYFPEFELDIDFAPRLCGRDPNLSLQITALKAQLNDTFELVFNATAGTQNPPRGWFANGAVELDIHTFRSGILKPLEIDTQVNGGGLIIPQPAPDHDFRTGTFGFQTVLKYQF